MDRPSPEQAEFFAAQYERIYKKLYLTALSILRNPSLAEDALQEAALKSYEKYSSLREPACFSTWMSRVVINECRQLLRRNRNAALPLSELEESGLCSFDEEQWLFFDLISRQKKSDREILTLRYFHQLSLEEISGVLSLPLSTVKSRLYRSLEAIKKDWREPNELHAMG